MTCHQNTTSRVKVLRHPELQTRVIHRNLIRTPNCSDRRQIVPLTESWYAQFARVRGILVSRLHASRLIVRPERQPSRRVARSTACVAVVQRAPDVAPSIASPLASTARVHRGPRRDKAVHRLLALAGLFARVNAIPEPPIVDTALGPPKPEVVLQ